MQNVQLLRSPRDGNPRGIGRFAGAFGQRRRGTVAAPRRFRPGRPCCAGARSSSGAKTRCCKRRQRSLIMPSAARRRGLCARQPPTAIYRDYALRGARWLRLPASLPLSRDGAGVEHHDVGLGTVGRPPVAGPLPADPPAARSRGRSSDSRRCGTIGARAALATAARRPRRHPAKVSCATISHGAMVRLGGSAQRMVSPRRSIGPAGTRRWPITAFAAHRLEEVTRMR